MFYDRYMQLWKYTINKGNRNEKKILVWSHFIEHMLAQYVLERFGIKTPGAKAAMKQRETIIDDGSGTLNITFTWCNHLLQKLNNKLLKLR